MEKPEAIKANEIIRVRFAPSPTGFLHIGGMRTALFNYLFAKKHQGLFILRIEDTDQDRSRPEFEKNILESLDWLGIKYDEGPENHLLLKNDLGPYRQSERLNIYAKYLQKLLDEDKAYYCFCSAEELEIQKQEQMSRAEPPHYAGKCSRLNPEIKQKYLNEKKPSVIRFRVTATKITFKDLIRGTIEFDLSSSGDMIIAKNLHSPLYNFACAVDDYEMKISHIIRGEEHISNTPKQIIIQQALEFPSLQYAHLPLILAPNRTKLSKRDGAVSITEYQEQGYLAEALINFIVLLGWNPGTEKEIYPTISSLIEDFSLERVQKGGAIFNIQRLDYLNGLYIRQKSIQELTQLCLPYFLKTEFIKQESENNFEISETKEEISLKTLEKIVLIYQERLKKLSEISDLTDFFFKKKLNYDKILLKWKEMQDKEIVVSLTKSEKILSKIEKENFNKENLEKILMAEAEKEENRGVLLWPLRVALTGKQASASPFEVAEILGKEKTIKRTQEAKELLCLNK